MGSDSTVPHDFKAMRPVARSSQSIAAVRQAILMQSTCDNSGRSQR
jgi:hypothetical protein